MTLRPSSRLATRMRAPSHSTSRAAPFTDTESTLSPMKSTQVSAVVASISSTATTPKPVAPRSRALVTSSATCSAETMIAAARAAVSSRVRLAEAFAVVTPPCSHFPRPGALRSPVPLRAQRLHEHRSARDQYATVKRVLRCAGVATSSAMARPKSAPEMKDSPASSVTSTSPPVRYVPRASPGANEPKPAARPM